MDVIAVMISTDTTRN